MKKSVKIILTILFIFIVLIVAALFYLKSQAAPIVNGEATKEVRVEIPYGTSAYKVAVILKENGLIKNEKIFYYTARYPKIKKILFSNEVVSDFDLKSGVYYVKDNMCINEIQELLSSGQQEYIKISVPEGYTISKIAGLLEESNICDSKSFINICKNSVYAEKHNIPGENVEGYLFPDTYFLTVGMSAEAVADIMINNFYEKIKTIPNLSEKNAEDLYYTVRLASIVEREYRVEDEAPLIASVFKNRLRNNIGLYSCATVEYIITEIEGRPHPERILISDTKIDNPYNTYKWAGLPPGAISNPGLVALDAATNTPSTKYFFFQVVDAEAGRHVFSTNFDDHVENHLSYTKKAAGKK